MKILTLIIGLSIFGGIAYNRKDWINQSQWRKVRIEILNRDETNGYWICKYSGIRFDNPSSLDIDHIIPLKYASTYCGDNLTSEQKHSFATDDSNLISVSAHENRSKGDDGLSQYIPPVNKCWYLKHWKYMAAKYKLCLPKEDSLILYSNSYNCNI